MSKPDLPTRPMADPDLISAEWLCRLLDCVEYAMTHPQPDGRTIFSDGTDTFRVPLPASTMISPTQYFGYFAVVPVDGTEEGARQLKIIDSTRPDSGIAGFTDLSTDSVPATFLPFPSGSASVYLVAKWTGEAYELEITTSLPTSGSEWGYFELARIENGKVYQVYTDGGRIMFSERFFV